MELTESGKDRVTYTCQKCGAINTFTYGPNFSNPKKKKESVTKLSAVLIRDHSSKEKNNTVPKQTQAEPPKQILSLIREAMADTVVFSFDYVTSDNKKSSRNVEPYKLTRRNGDLILFAFDLESGGIRTFKIHSMSYAAKQPYAYKPRYDIEDKLKDD